MNVYEILTNRIMDLLQEGEIPWRKPWKATGGARNFVSKKPYRGINQFLLNAATFSSGYWMTFKQASEKGGQVRKGEKSTMVVFWKFINTVTKDDDDPDAKGELTQVPLLRYYRVFNLDQIDGIEAPVEEQPANHFQPIEQAELIMMGMPYKPIIHYGGDQACYSPNLDRINLPKREASSSPEEFYSTVFHELAHSTGHPIRLKRKGILEPSYFGSHNYSQEELVAEFASSMLCGVAGIEQQTIENSAAYIQGWLKRLKNDKKLAIIAAGQAQRAADFILNRQDTEPRN